MTAPDQQQETRGYEYDAILHALERTRSGTQHVAVAALDALAARLAAAETALREIVAFPVDEGKSGGWHFAEVRQIARAYFASPDAAAEEGT